MTQKRRLPLLALVCVAAAHAVPPPETGAARLSNDFVFRALAQDTKENVAITPGGPLAGLAALGAAGNPLPEKAARQIGGSPQAAKQLLRALGASEQGLRPNGSISHARSAWLSNPVSIEPSVVEVRPAVESETEATTFLDRLAPRAVLATKPEAKKEVRKPVGLATVSALEAARPFGLVLTTPQEYLTFDGQSKVKTLRGIGFGYVADEIAQTVSVPLTESDSHRLVLCVPRPEVKLEAALSEVQARFDAALGSKDAASVQMPCIQMNVEMNVADALGLGNAEIAVQTRTTVAIGPPDATIKDKASRISGPSHMHLPVWRPNLLPSMGRGQAGQVQKELPNVQFDRPFVYAVVDRESGAYLLAGIVRKVEPAKK